MSDVQTGAMLCLPLDVCHTLAHDLPRSRTMDAALRCIDGVRRRMLGDGLLTVNVDASPAYDESDTIDLQRVWTSDAEAYPVGGRKRKTLTPWTRQLLRRAQMFVGEGDAALREVFDDHALIAALGLRAVVNVPLLDAQGRCAATFNLLGVRPTWQPQELALVQLLALLATPWVLADRGA
ncbi:GAF domain-containing protein [Variovorax sp. ZT4R33]|uniref:GAF domain-containing protein n=1 Tax=Variovorax sp. ZT4R33 TaxID=3443743 RepID=UPI003F4513A5